MTNNFGHALQTEGLFAVIPLIMLLIGVYNFLYNLWGLVTGGPRALHRPGAPFLYDRLYFLLWLVVTTGWLSFIVSFVAEELAGDSAAPDTLFLVSWAIMAVGMGLMYWLRGNMMIEGTRYRAQYAAPLRKWLNRMQLKQYERQPDFVRKLVSGLFFVIGLGILILNFREIPQAAGQLLNEVQQMTRILAGGGK